ncbi:winged helix-turn-helix domain-containing protein [Adlercreutzia aquisgranensis]|uniref:winged helix-turn-helix domain-containing protein n=1 Tax=Adlercreutzia aquisgranensis TaxID=2941323 RepID=UPI002040FC49|nr:LysR family transcriptional regulator [Adlercreutzia aquisgranensis]
MSTVQTETTEARQVSDDPLKSLTPVIRLAIAATSNPHGSEFGRGVAKLCRGVQDKGSLNAAAKDMGMAYSKAWRILRDTETALGVTLLHRDGAHGSTLTEDCERLLKAYSEMEERLQQIAREEFRSAL